MDAVQQANAGHPGTAMALAPLAYLLYTRGAATTTRRTRTGPTATASSSPPATRASSSTRRCTSPATTSRSRSCKRFRQWESLTPGPPRGAPHAGHRGDDRAARAGLRERRRLGDRRALPRRALQPPVRRDRRPPRLRDLLRRRPDGGRLERGGVDRRARSVSASSSTSTTTTTSRSTARRRSRSREDTGSALRGATAGTCSTSTTRTTSTRCARDRERAGGDGAAVARSSCARTSPTARRTRSTPRRRTARRSARRRCARRRRRSAGIPTSTFFVPDEVRAHMNGSRARQRARAGVAAAARGVVGGDPGAARATGTRRTRAGRARLARGAARVRGRRGASRRATPAQSVMQAFKHVSADDDRRRGRPRRVDEDGVQGRRALLRRRTPAATSPSASASTRWARSSTASRSTAACVKPYGSTFLIFSDYMRPPVRLSALMRPAGRLGVDARLGRARRGRPDAPAGRALRALRAIPNLWFVRPADANETAARGGSRSSARTGRSGWRSRARRCRRSTARARAADGRRARRLRPLGAAARRLARR